MEEILSADEVDEAVPHIALVLSLKQKYFDVAGQVEKVIGVFQPLVNLIRQIFNSILVWNIANHQGGPRVSPDLLFPHYKAVTVSEVAHAITARLEGVEVIRKTECLVERQGGRKVVGAGVALGD